MAAGSTLELDGSPDFFGLHGISPMIANNCTLLDVLTGKILLASKGYSNLPMKRAKFDLKPIYLDTIKNLRQPLTPKLTGS